MAIHRHFALAEKQAPHGPFIPILDAGKKNYPGFMCMDARWYAAPFTQEEYIRHDSDELLVFIGGDRENPEALGAQIEYWIENDRLTLTNTCAIYIPKGAAHGKMVMRNVTRPVFRLSVMLESDTYEEIPAEATAPEGTYAGNKVEKYAPLDGKMPTAPEGFLTLLLWLDDKKLSGAPYLEAVWFNTENDTGPEAHAHEFDEFIGFIGTDPENPEELGAEVRFVMGDEEFVTTKSTLVHIPRGVTHSPILVPKMDRPILHFSGSNNGKYIREGSDKF